MQPCWQPLHPVLCCLRIQKWIQLFTEDKMNAPAVTLCRPDDKLSFAKLKKCLWLRRGHSYFLQTEAPSEEGTEDWCDTRNFPPWISKQILVRGSTGRMSILCFKETAWIYSKVSGVGQIQVAPSPALGLLLLTELVQSKAGLVP